MATDAPTPPPLRPDATQIAILLYDRMTALDAIGPYEVLSRLPDTQVCFVGESTGPKRTDTGCLALTADYALSDLPEPDVVVIPGGKPMGPMGSEATLSWIRQAHKTTKWTTSVCTGSLILGAAGLLAGTKATTHWASTSFISRFGGKFTDARYVTAGKIITAAGVSAGIDMALYLAEQLAGRESAEAMQLLIEYDPQPPVHSGSLTKASPAVVSAARALLAASQ